MKKPLENETAQKVAEFLLQIKAIKLNPTNPFTWASGWKSPIYCDNRKTLSYPKIRTFIRQELSNSIIENFGTPDIIAGVATGGIAQGALVAQELGLPFIYVRPKAKDHGLGNLIEGAFEADQNVVVIEDLVSTGASSLSAVKALEEGGLKVKGMVAVFTYNFKTAKDNFKKAKCKLASLTDYDILIEQAKDAGYIRDKDLKSLIEWKNDPEGWTSQFI